MLDMKLNVYVPDELWSQARDAKSGSNPSQVVQAGLQALLAASSAPARLSDARPAGADESLERAAARLLGDARAEFSDGYAAGLRLGEALPWAQLQKFARESQGDLRSRINRGRTRLALNTLLARRRRMLCTRRSRMKSSNTTWRP